MRITTSMMYNQLTTNVNNSTANYQSLENELSTGNQINQPSDNPTGTSQIITINSLLVDMNQYQSNISNATTALKYADSQLNSIQELVTQARTTAVSAANDGTQDANTEASYAQQISTIIDEVTNLANTTYEGRYVFSGTASNTAPYTVGDATHAYNGNSGVMTATIGANSTVNTNVPGSQVFTQVFSALEQIKTDITTNTTASISNISSSGLSALDAGLNDITTTRGSMGVTVDELQSATSRLNTQQTSYKSNLANVQNVDIATVYAQLQVAQNIYQSSLVATSKAMQYSLADYL